jgi:hypothetical protein
VRWMFDCNITPAGSLTNDRFDPDHSSASMPVKSVT